MNKDYYKILGVERNASEDEIKLAYKKNALKYHPDRNPNNKEAEEKFKEINEAYSVLSNPSKKQQYDTFGSVDETGFNINPEDIFKNFFRGHGFGFGFDDEPMERQYKGGDKVIKINVTLSEIYNNSPKTVTYSVKRPCSHCSGSGSKNGKVEQCPHCGGTGQIHNRRQSGMMFIDNITTCPYCDGSGQVITDKCEHCDGTGLVDSKDSILINVPDIGKILTQRYVHKGGGHSCQNGLGVNGDLIFTFNISDNEGYEIDTNNALNIIKTIEIPMIDCLLGTSVNVKHLDGKTYTVNIGECTPNGKLYRKQWKGFRIGNQVGDLYYKVKQVMPDNLSEEDRKILNKLKKSKTFK